MQIYFSPMRFDTPLTLSRAGDILTLNGATLDLSSIPEGATVADDAIESIFVTKVERNDGMLHITLRLPHAAYAPDETLFPTPITVVEDGPVALPPYTLEDSTDA